MAALLALPAGALALAILLVDELDEAFANLYSTAVSAQNLRPTLDRRVVAVVVGALATGVALSTDVIQYEGFLFLIGSVFIPLYAVLLLDSGPRRRAAGDGRAGPPARPLMLLPWLAGFATYQLLNPGTVAWWAEGWQRAQAALHLVPPAWASASLTSFAVAAAATLLVSPLERRRSRPARA
jgi:NCS1 family nucleobase:cation symporter-1